MIFDLVIAIAITRYLRKKLQMATEMPKWDRIFNYIFYAAIVLLVLDSVVAPFRIATTWLSHFLMLYLIYVLYTEKQLAAARQVLLAIAPFILLSLFSDFLKLTDQAQFTSWKNLIQTATTFSVVWMVTMWVIINKQKKALEKE